MAVKFQYNKTSLNEIGKQLKVRQKALPTLQNKESALRLEVRKAKNESDRLIADLEAAMDRYDYLASLWNEFDPGLVAITDVDLHTVKVAGVKTPALGDIHYEIRPFNAFAKPAWYADAQNAKTKLENGFDLSDYDVRCLDYAKDYARELLAIDVNISITEMLDTAWKLFAKYFTPAETGIKQALVDKYWKA